MTTDWFFNPAIRSNPDTRLVCLPYAGSSAAAYRRWGDRFPANVEVLAVQLPGRGWRLGETPIDSLRGMVSSIASELADLSDLPLVLFGHSMGAWLGLELARTLESRGRPPDRLVVSARQPPADGFTQPPLSHLSDEDFVSSIQSRYRAIPTEILADPDVLALLLPALRADIAALESYRYRAAPPLACGVTAFGGTEDRIVPFDALDGWQYETSGPFRSRAFAGGHFYLDDADCGLFEEILGEIEIVRTTRCCPGTD